MVKSECAGGWRGLAERAEMSEDRRFAMLWAPYRAGHATGGVPAGEVKWKNRL